MGHLITSYSIISDPQSRIWSQGFLGALGVLNKYKGFN